MNCLRKKCHSCKTEQIQQTDNHVKDNSKHDYHHKMQNANKMRDCTAQ